MSVPLGRPPPALRGRCALGQTRSGLRPGSWELGAGGLEFGFGSSGHVGAALQKPPAFFHSYGGAAAAAGGGGGGHEKANGF
jgi:hypothetical protein